MSEAGRNVPHVGSAAERRLPAGGFDPLEESLDEMVRCSDDLIDELQADLHEHEPGTVAAPASRAPAPSSRETVAATLERLNRLADSPLEPHEAIVEPPPAPAPATSRKEREDDLDSQLSAVFSPRTRAARSASDTSDDHPLPDPAFVPIPLKQRDASPREQRSAATRVEAPVGREDLSFLYQERAARSAPPRRGGILVVVLVGLIFGAGVWLMLSGNATERMAASPPPGLGIDRSEPGTLAAPPSGLPFTPPEVDMFEKGHSKPTRPTAKPTRPTAKPRAAAKPTVTETAPAAAATRSEPEPPPAPSADAATEAPIAAPEPAAEPVKVFEVVPLAPPEPEPGIAAPRVVDRPAEVIERQRLRYPAALQARAVAGVVVLRILVDETGRAAGVVVEKGSPVAELETAAISSVLGWKYRPALERGEPTRSWITERIVFEP